MGQRMDKNFRVTAKAEIGAHYCTHPGKSFDDGNNYHIYSAIRRAFHLSRMTTNNLISSM